MDSHWMYLKFISPILVCMVALICWEGSERIVASLEWSVEDQYGRPRTIAA